MKKFGYTTIPDWMLELGLRTPEVICFAVIFGFSQDGESTFKGSRKYLAWKMCVKDVKSVDAALLKLLKSGLIEKKLAERNGVKTPEYSICADYLRKENSMGCGETGYGRENFHIPNPNFHAGGMEKTDTIENNRNNKKNILFSMKKNGAETIIDL